MLIYFIFGWVFSFAALSLVIIAIKRILTKKLDEDPEDTRLEKLVFYAIAVMGLFVFFMYVGEACGAWFSGNEYDRAQFQYRISGPHAWVYYVEIITTGILPITLLWRRPRRNPLLLLLITLAIGAGAVFERITFYWLYISEV